MARTMERRVELNLKNADQVRNVLEQNQGLPVIMLTENGPDDYSWYYHEAVEAKAEWLLFGEFCEGVGIQFDKIYDGEDEVVCEVSEALFESWWDCAVEHGMSGKLGLNDVPSDVLSDFCGVELDMGDFADTLARAICESLPWSKWVVIRAWL